MSRQDNNGVLVWCSDALHDLLGFTDSALASFLVAVASRTKSSPAKIMQQLQNGGVDEKATRVDKLESFSRELYRRCQQQRSGRTKGKQQATTTTNADWIAKAKTYALVQPEDDDYEQQEGATALSQNPSKERKEKKKSKKASKERTKKSSSSLSDKRSKKRQRRRYGIDDDNDDDDDDDDEPTVKRPQHRRRFEDDYDDDNDSGDDDDDADNNNDHQPKKSRLTEKEKAELERERDRKERDEFVQRMLERDEQKTMQKARDTQATRAQQLDTERRLARGETVLDPTTGREMTLQSLQEQSRRLYLKKRTERQVELKERELLDEQDMFRGQTLTAAEQRRIELDRRIIRMARGQQGDNDDDNDDQNDGFYRLPDEYDEKQSKALQDQALLTSRYRETKGEKTEQELWEESQTNKAAGLAGGTKKKKKNKEKQYELVFEDQIDFVMQSTSKGYDRREERYKRREREEEEEAAAKEERQTKDQPRAEEARPTTAHEKILAGRKKLPVFPYREELLAAVKEHQVLILVGETGSGKV